MPYQDVLERIVDFANSHWSGIVATIGAAGVLLKGAEMAAKALAWWTGQPHLKGRIVEDDKNGLTFDAENVGGRQTSLHPEVQLSFWYFQRRSLWGFCWWRPRLDHATYDTREIDRSLPTAQPRRFHAVPRYPLPEGYIFSWYRSYRFRPTTGAWKRPLVLRTENALLEPLGRVVFKLRVFLMLVLRYLPESKPMDIDQYEAGRRSRGSF